MCVFARLGVGAVDLLVAVAVASERSQVPFDSGLVAAAARSSDSTFVVEIVTRADKFEMCQLETERNS